MPSRQTIQPRTLSHSVDLFAGGMDSDASPYRVAEGQAVLGENIEFYRDNTLRSRKGYELKTPITQVGQFITQRLNGVIKNVYRDGALYKAVNIGQIEVLGAASSAHNFIRVVNGVLAVEPEGIKLLDTDGLQAAGVNTPLPLTGATGEGGKLTEGSYTYTYNYLLVGGAESPQSAELEITVTDKDSKVTLNIPANPAHPKLFKLRLYRQNPGDGFPLFIKELPVNTTTYVDKGDIQSALMPLQGVRQMPGGNLALLQNRRLFVVDGDVLNYSYPGNYGYSNDFWTEKVSLPTGEPIRAICPLGQGVVFFGLETAIYMNAVPSEGGSFSPIPVPDGCVSQTAWTQAEDGTLIYVGKSGVYAMQGASAQRISDPVNDRFRNYTPGQLRDTTMVFDQQERRLLVALPGEILVYYFQTKAWSVWTIPGAKLDWFEGRIHVIYQSKLGILGEFPTDNGAPITGRFVSGIHGFEDQLQFKLFRRMGIQVSATGTDTVNMGVKALDSNTTYQGLPPRPSENTNWDNSFWDTSLWSGNLSDVTQTVSLPDFIQGRYIQFTITFSTTNADQFVITGPAVIEYRPRYRYGRG
jgi:hypothetical protein